MHEPMVFVTNKNEFHHYDRYDGTDYHFPPGERVCIPIAAAEHFFGYRKPDKNDSLQRQGWAFKIEKDAEGRSKTVESPEGIKKLARFVFSKAVLVEEKEPLPSVPGQDDDPPVTAAPSRPIINTIIPKGVGLPPGATR